MPQPLRAVLRNIKSVLSVSVYGRYLGGYLLKNIEDYLHGVEGGEYRHSVLDCTAAYLNAVLKVDAGENGAGVYNIADIARADRIENLSAALAELAAHAGAYAVLLEERRGSGGRLDIEAEMIEALDERQSLLLVLIGKGDYYRTVFILTPDAWRALYSARFSRLS